MHGLSIHERVQSDLLSESCVLKRRLKKERGEESPSKDDRRFLPRAGSRESLSDRGELKSSLDGFDDSLDGVSLPSSGSRLAHGSSGEKESSLVGRPRLRSLDVPGLDEGAIPSDLMRRRSRGDSDGDSIDLEKGTCVLSPKLRLRKAESEDLLDFVLEVCDVDGYRLAPSLFEDVVHELDGGGWSAGRGEAEG